MVGKMERKWQLIIFFIAMILLSAGGYCYMNSEVTAPPEMERYDFGQFTMEIPEDSDVELIGSDLSLSVYAGDNIQVINVNKTFYENQDELNHILEQTTIENLTNSSRIVETSNNITYYQITDENNIIGFENDTYIVYLIDQRDVLFCDLREWKQVVLVCPKHKLASPLTEGQSILSTSK